MFNLTPFLVSRGFSNNEEKLPDFPTFFHRRLELQRFTTVSTMYTLHRGLGAVLPRLSLLAPSFSDLRGGLHTGAGRPSKKGLKRQLLPESAAPHSITKMRLNELEPSSPMVKEPPRHLTTKPHKNLSGRGPDIELASPIVELASPIVEEPLPISSKPAISPLPDAGEARLPVEWGFDLMHYTPLRVPCTKPDGGTVDRSDMGAVLDISSSDGWLTNFGIDA